jgi:hypothetical protein
MKRPKNLRPDSNRYPNRLNRKKVQDLINYYENQTDDEAIAEAEAAYRDNATTMMQIPNKLVPKVRKLTSKHRFNQGRTYGLIISLASMVLLAPCLTCKTWTVLS